MAEVTAAGGDLIVRAGWRMVRWLDDDGRPLDIVALLQGSADGVIDRSIKLARHGAAPLSVRPTFYPPCCDPQAADRG